MVLKESIITREFELTFLYIFETFNTNRNNSVQTYSTSNQWIGIDTMKMLDFK